MAEAGSIGRKGQKPGSSGKPQAAARAATRAPRKQRPWLLYVLECRGGKLYIGISPDPEARFRLHLKGTGAKYTRANPPLRILAARAYAGRSEASAAEHALKQLRRPAKLLWVRQHLWPPQSKPAGAVAIGRSARGGKRAAAASGG